MSRAPKPLASGFLKEFTLTISAEAVFRELGYTAEDPPAAVHLTFRRLLSQGLKYLQPAVAYRIFPFSNQTQLRSPGGTDAAPDRLRSLWRTTYFAATLGELFDAHLRLLNRRGEFLAAIIWDVIGNVATAELVKVLKTRLMADYETEAWNPILPAKTDGGELPQLLRLAQADRLPVVVSEKSRLLSPSKSCVGYFHVRPR